MEDFNNFKHIAGEAGEDPVGEEILADDLIEEIEDLEDLDEDLFGKDDSDDEDPDSVVRGDPFDDEYSI